MHKFELDARHGRKTESFLAALDEAPPNRGRDITALELVDATLAAWMKRLEELHDGLQGQRPLELSGELTMLAEGRELARHIRELQEIRRSLVAGLLKDDEARALLARCGR